MTAQPSTIENIDDQVLPTQPFDLVGEEDDDDELVYYFYDDVRNFNRLRLRDMSGSDHEMLKQYLMAVISWMFRAQQCAVYGELNFYETDQVTEEPLYPDVAVLKGQEWRRLKSYRLNVDGPPPNMVFELLSDKTRRSDLLIKPVRYQKWGIKEYFTYDLRPRKRRSKYPRLQGWRMNEAGLYTALSSDEVDGRLWSEQLECWLVPEDAYLRLYDKDNELIMTRADRLAQRLRELGEDPDQL